MVREGDGPEDQQIRDMLATKMMPPFKLDGETNIDAVAKYFVDATQIPLLVSQPARERWHRRV